MTDFDFDDFDLLDFDETLKILEDIIQNYPSGTDEYNAILTASEAIVFLQRNKARDQFKDFIEKMRSSLTGFDFMYLKSYGLEIPEEFRTPEILALESEMDTLVSKIQKIKILRK